MEMIGLTKEEWYARLFERLGRSKFRSGFHLTQKDIDYIHEKGLDTIRQHARDFIAQREAPAFIPNDGKQTPMRGHPVFVAQHATATCCRECIRKWHTFAPGVELGPRQQEYLVDVIMTWIERELAVAEEKVAEETVAEDAETSQTGKVMADEAVTLQAPKVMSNDIKMP